MSKLPNRESPRMRAKVCETETAAPRGAIAGRACCWPPLRAHDRGGSAAMTAGPGTSATELSTGNRRLAILLAMAMFVLVVDTSVMNVSIAAVVHDLHTTVSGVQSAIALE